MAKREALTKTETIPAAMFRTHLGAVLEEIRNNRRFLLTRRGVPVAVLVSMEDYVQGNPEFEDVADFLDTLIEESDSEFQRSLKRGYEAMKKGEFYTLRDLKGMLAKKADV